MYSKVKLAGHPIHPMLIAFPVACYTGTLVGFAVYVANGHLFWLNLAIALNVVGVGGAVAAALPGLVDWALGIPRDSAAKIVGVGHAVLNVVALGLFAASLGIYVGNWNGPAVDGVMGLGLSSAGVALTLAAGFLGWTLVQDFHVGVRLVPEQELAEPAVQRSQPLPLRRHAA